MHGPENAEHELKKAYNSVIEAGVTHFWDRKLIPGVNPDEVLTIYKHAFQCYRKEDRLTAERWARAAKHLARAVWHEAKIAYLEPRVAELPYLEGATPEEYNLHEHSDTTEDLLNSVETHIPKTDEHIQQLMQRYLQRGRKHLLFLNQEDYKNELLRFERIKAAHEYGRVLECIALAYEAEEFRRKAA